ncbi:MAG: hypothetical protein N2504_00780 [candidate division WOR-3 bacterium]|nr:hypothetical protein [candidate division WOR-3 bacterium]MCX7947109.1 hypothetical protein [candidate division WOR-3 bacterium]MDW8149850.1 hypothetical protein [candidate division WOR-3 bacterium]
MLKYKKKTNIFPIVIAFSILIMMISYYFTKKITLLILLAISTIVLTIISYLLQKNYNKISDFEIKVDDEGIYYKLPRNIADYYNIEHEKAKYLWKQIKLIRYSSEENLIYIVLVSKVKIPILVSMLSKNEIEKLIEKISSYTNIEVL